MYCVWDRLSNNKNKENLFKEDQYFNYSLKIANKVLNSEKNDVLSNYALLLIKPESFMFNKIDEILNLLIANEFQIIYYNIKQLTWLQCLELWKYQWPAASIERVFLSQTLMSYSESMVLILKNSKYNKSFLSTYLSSLKGSANETERKSNNFRSVLKPINRMLNYIHTSDEPADMIRELGILFDWEELLQIYEVCNVGKPIDYTLIRRISDKYIRYVDGVNPLEMILELKSHLKQLIKAGTIDVSYNFINKLEKIINNEEKIDLTFIFELMSIDGIKWSWELIVILTTYIKNDSGSSKTI